MMMPFSEVLGIFDIVREADCFVVVTCAREGYAIILQILKGKETF